MVLRSTVGHQPLNLKRKNVRRSGTVIAYSLGDRHKYSNFQRHHLQRRRYVHRRMPRSWDCRSRRDHQKCDRRFKRSHSFIPQTIPYPRSLSSIAHQWKSAMPKLPRISSPEERPQFQPIKLTLKFLVEYSSPYHQTQPLTAIIIIRSA